MDRVGNPIEFICTACGLQGVSLPDQLSRRKAAGVGASSGTRLSCPKCGRPLKVYHEVQSPALTTV
jgi:hypothetical protein